MNEKSAIIGNCSPNRQLTACGLERTGSGRLGSVQSASTWQGPSAWRRSPLPSVEATASAVYRQLRLRASSGRSAPAGVTAVAPIGLRTSAARPHASSRAVPNGRGRASFQAVGMRRMKLRNCADLAPELTESLPESVLLISSSGFHSSNPKS